MLFATLSVFKSTFLFCFNSKRYHRKAKCLWLCQLQLLHLINVSLHFLLISMLIAVFTYVHLFCSCYGSIVKTSKTQKHWYIESDTHTLRLSNTHKWERFVLNLQQATDASVFDSFRFFFIGQKYFVSNSAITFNIMKFLLNKIHSFYLAKHKF